MKRSITLIAAFFGIAIGLSTAHAAIIVNDTFETYTSQANFEGTWTPIGTAAPLSGEWSTEQSTSPTHSIKNPGTAANNQSRNQLTFPATPALAIGDQLVWSFDYWDNAPTGAPQRNFANLQTVAAPGTTPAGQLISMGLNNNQTNADSGGPAYMARILGYAHPAVDVQGGPGEAAGGTGSGAYFKMNDVATGGRGAAAGWRNLKMVLSTTTGTNSVFQFFVNNALAETEILASAPLQYTVIRMGSGLSNGSVPVYYDNMYLEYIPFNLAPVVNPEPPEVGLTTQGDIINTVFTATDATALPVTFSNAVLSAFVPLIPGATNPTFNGVVDAAGNFSWDTTGFARGVYTIDVTATDSGSPPLSGTGGSFVVTIENVPEPSTWALSGLAMIGSLGLVRRRKV